MATPPPQTLERLQEAGARVFRNDKHDDMVVTKQDDNVDVAVTKGS
jgi:beta-lactamase superfamily II metal-dependent hydrolase